jgi:hypothetical protein
MATTICYIIDDDGIREGTIDGYGEVKVGVPNGDVHYFTGAGETADANYLILPETGLLKIRRRGDSLRTYKDWVWVEGDRKRRTTTARTARVHIL